MKPLQIHTVFHVSPALTLDTYDPPSANEMSIFVTSIPVNTATLLAPKELLQVKAFHTCLPQQGIQHNRNFAHQLFCGRHKQLSKVALLSVSTRTLSVAVSMMPSNRDFLGN